MRDAASDALDATTRDDSTTSVSDAVTADVPLVAIEVDRADGSTTEDEEVASAAPDASTKDLLRFTLPTMLIWLAEPLLSLVDTSVVGLASTLELAAMAPGSVYSGYPAYLIAAGLAMATTTMIAQDRLLAAKGGADDEDERTVSMSLVTGIVMAVIMSAFLIAANKPLLAMYIGAANIGVLPHASAYSVIRLLSLPVGIAIAVAEAAFLASKDPWTPLKAVALTTTVNLVLDIWFVTGLGWGIRGAAWATSISQVCTVILLMRALIKRGPEIDKVKTILRENAARASTSNFNLPTEHRALRNVGAPALRLPIRMPEMKFLQRVRSIAAPVMCVLFIKCVFVGWIVRTATYISPEASAANGVLFTVYFFFAVIGDGVSQASQTFLPPTLGDFDKASKLAFRILYVAVGIGIFNALVSGFVPTRFPYLFTTSPAVVELMFKATPYMCAALLAHTSSMASEGCLLACRDGAFMVSSYIPNSILSVVTLNFLLAQGWGVCSSWIALTQFHFVRLFINYARLGLRKSSPLNRELGAGVA
jgi:Na+-driven multidrug efflux pump